MNAKRLFLLLLSNPISIIIMIHIFDLVLPFGMYEHATTFTKYSADIDTNEMACVSALRWPVFGYMR